MEQGDPARELRGQLGAVVAELLGGQALALLAQLFPVQQQLIQSRTVGVVGHGNTSGSRGSSMAGHSGPEVLDQAHLRRLPWALIVRSETSSTPAASDWVSPW